MGISIRKILMAATIKPFANAKGLPVIRTRPPAIPFAINFSLGGFVEVIKRSDMGRAIMGDQAAPCELVIDDRCAAMDQASMPE